MNASDLHTLNGLIRICEDGVKAFQQAIEHVSDPDLRIKFGELEGKYAAAAGAMKRFVSESGEEYADGGSVVGSIHRLFTDIKFDMTGDASATGVEALRQTHATALERFRHALGRELSEDAKTRIELHYLEIERTGFHTI